MNLNLVILAGRLTKKPELKKTPSGKSVASFGLATNKSWTDKGGQKQEKAEFHNIVCWGKLAEIASQWLEKGQVASVKGSLQTRNWEDKNKQKRYITEIVADDIQFGQKAGGGRAEEEAPAATTDEEAPPIAAEDLPF